MDRVLPAVPVRQWMLTLPYPLRFRCAYDAQLFFRRAKTMQLSWWDVSYLEELVVADVLER